MGCGNRRCFVMVNIKAVEIMKELVESNELLSSEDLKIDNV